MPDTCIVCLSDLASAAEQSEGDGQIEAFAGTAESVQPSAIQQNPNAVAKILPCKHQLHNHCLGPWVRRANSCPMCRTNFNTVELSLYKDGERIDLDLASRPWAELRLHSGPCLSSFQVKDKIQAAHFDDTIALEPEIFDNLTDSCLLCEVLIASDDLLVCDTCQGAFHMACAVSTVPSSPWTCRFCCEDAGVPLNTAQRQRYRHVQHRHRVQATSDTEWASVWRAIHTQDQLDLHFPFADEEPESVPAAHRRDIEAWHRRLNAAEQQGSATRFRQNAASILESNDSLNINSGASQDEIQAWRAFETARDVENPLASSNNRSKRRSRSSSPAQPEQGSEAPRRFKRPRTRRVNGVSDVAEENRDENAILVAGPSTASAPLNSRRTDANGIGPSHFKSILQEVEKGSETSAAQPRGRSQLKINASTGSNPSSPRSLSPMTPTSRSSGQFSPCFHPDSPALSRTSRSASPPPLTSRVEPTYPQPAFYSPAPPLRNRQISDADSKVPSGSQRYVQNFFNVF